MNPDYQCIDSLRRSLKLPRLLIDLMKSGRWSHSGMRLLKVCASFIRDPLVVLPTIDSMFGNSGPLMGHEKAEDELFHEYRGSCLPYRPLPWIDVEKTIFIMCNERIGDDCGIALDYRLDFDNPHVIGSDWHSGFKGVQYRHIADSFDDFVSKVGLSVTDIETT